MQIDGGLPMKITKIEPPRILMIPQSILLTPMMLLQVFKILIKMCTTYTICNSIPQTLLFKAEPSINRHALPYFAQITATPSTPI